MGSRDKGDGKLLGDAGGLDEVGKRESGRTRRCTEPADPGPAGRCTWVQLSTYWFGPGEPYSARVVAIADNRIGVPSCHPRSEFALLRTLSRMS